MNIRKNIDYSEMYEALDMLMAQQLPQMELYCEIGKVVCWRMEKGAAVMASEYLSKKYPDVKGFSPRSLRRMRDFYRTYENYPDQLRRAKKLGWIQNVIFRSYHRKIISHSDGHSVVKVLSLNFENVV